jgi:hypothetical protein
VIFLSALNGIEDKVAGFKSGGVDYISKPFQFEEVKARVETHIKLRRAQQAEHELLEKTLGGAVRALWELVQLSSPLLAIRSHALRDIVLWIAKRMHLADSWQHELAAMLCLIGCVTLPEDIVERVYFGETLSSEEQRMFSAHPETAARLLANIPRLEAVAGIIREQLNPTSDSVEEGLRTGVDILKLALELDRKMYNGAPAHSVLAELKASRRFDRSILETLEGYSPSRPDFELRRLPIHELRARMVLEKDVYSSDGKMVILKRGTMLTETWIERLENFARTRRVQEIAEVRVPAFRLQNSDERRDTVPLMTS